MPSSCENGKAIIFLMLWHFQLCAENDFLRNYNGKAQVKIKFYNSLTSCIGHRAGRRGTPKYPDKNTILLIFLWGMFSPMPPFVARHKAPTICNRKFLKASAALIVAKIIRNARLNLAERKVNNCSAKFALGFF